MSFARSFQGCALKRASQAFRASATVATARSALVACAPTRLPVSSFNQSSFKPMAPTQSFVNSSFAASGLTTDASSSDVSSSDESGSGISEGSTESANPLQGKPRSRSW
uniref:Uncharacterized protein n=1 Tax=Polytomella parva TaxID=51329 RepID=A0A7S0YA95_9CHLO